MQNYEIALHKINNGCKLGREEIFAALQSLLDVSDQNHVSLQMGMILYGLSTRGPEVNEVLGLCDFVKNVEPSLLKRKLVAQVDRPVIGFSGSGKKGIKTFNISTPAALVAATAGAFIAKPVSSATSSTTGSADLLQVAGANLNLTHEQMVRVLEQTGFGAFSIENTIPAFDSIYGGRFYAPHALSYALAAITNPVNCAVMIHGLAGKRVDVAAKVLKELGIKNGVGISSTEDGTLYVDELTPLKKNYVAFYDETSDVTYESIDIGEHFGCSTFEPHDLRPGLNNQYQLKIFLDCLRGSGSEAQLSAVALNAALIIMNSKIQVLPRQAFALARDTIASGAAERTLERFCDITKSFGLSFVQRPDSNGRLIP